MHLTHDSKGKSVLWPILLCIIVVSACSGHTGQMAGQGAATGAIAGSVGGLVSALVFGGDPVERAARGAVWGASTGAVAGAVAGSRVDDAKKKQAEAAELERLKAEIGEDAFNGLAALAECKHEVALGYARSAEKSENKDYALAGLWLEILAYGDKGETGKAKALFPDLMSKDPKINTAAQAEETMGKALQDLGDIREEYKLPRVCR